MLHFNIQDQDKFSRSQLLVRLFFGWIYILIPHVIALYFVAIASGMLRFLAFWSIMFTGKYPKGWFDFQVQFLRWQTRLNASLYNLQDDYPALGLSVETANLELEIDYQEDLNRSDILIRALFGFFYIALPHAIILTFRFIATHILAILAFWVVLFTGKYPKSWFAFNVGTLRWGLRVNAYLSYLTHDYPPFSGK
jgi:hypothetical protein